MCVTSAGYKKHFGVVSSVTFSLHAGNQSRNKMRSGTRGNVETALKMNDPPHTAMSCRGRSAQKRSTSGIGVGYTIFMRKYLHSYYRNIVYFPPHSVAGAPLRCLPPNMRSVTSHYCSRNEALIVNAKTQSNNSITGVDIVI